MRRISRLIIHCTATRPTWMRGQSADEKVEAIARWHQAKGWRDIGYHWLIDRDGVIACGRPECEIGAHVRGHNADSIGIALVGGFGASADDLFADHFTSNQDRALRNLIVGAQSLYLDAEVSGHNEYAAKGCPGFQVQAWLGGAA